MSPSDTRPRPVPAAVAAELSTDRESSDSLATGRVLAIGAACAVFVALSVTAQTYLSMLGHGHSFWRMLWWQLSVSGLWALFAPTIMRLGARPSVGIRAAASPTQWWLLVLAYGVATITAHIAVTAGLAMWLRPFVPVEVTVYATALRAQFESQFVTDILVFAMLLVLGRTVAVSERASRLALRESRLEAELARAHLEALRLEIQPHFLFNTLNSIAALIRLHANDKALDMLLGLGSLMRTTIDRPPDHLTSLASEVAFVRQYLDLQSARFGDRLDVGFDIAPDTLSIMVPSFLLQPLVENALRHGIARKAGHSRLDVRAHVDAEGQLVVEVQDDGSGLPPGFDLDQAAGTGLRNVRVRLQQLFGPTASLTVFSPGGLGTIVRVMLPASEGTSLAKETA
jgi:two-component system, LytTR family, sensor kinase